MENIQELIPLAKEMLNHRPGRGLLKVYLLGSVFAVLGTAIGLVETLCHPFSSGEPLDAEMLLILAREHTNSEILLSLGGNGEEEEQAEELKQEKMKKVQAEQEEALIQEDIAKTSDQTSSKTYRLNQRNISNRLHAS